MMRRCHPRDGVPLVREEGARDITYQTTMTMTISTRLSTESRIFVQMMTVNSTFADDWPASVYTQGGSDANRDHLRNLRRTRVGSIAIVDVKKTRLEEHRGVHTTGTSPTRIEIVILLRSPSHRRTRIRTRTRGKRKGSLVRYPHG